MHEFLTYRYSPRTQLDMLLQVTLSVCKSILAVKRYWHRRSSVTPIRSALTLAQVTSCVLAKTDGRENALLQAQTIWMQTRDLSGVNCCLEVQRRTSRNVGVRACLNRAAGTMLQAARLCSQKEGLRLAVAGVCPVVDVAGATQTRVLTWPLQLCTVHGKFLPSLLLGQLLR